MSGSAILTFTTYTLAGHMREQVCVYMCPWPRIQAAMTDGRPKNANASSWDFGRVGHLRRLPVSTQKTISRSLDYFSTAR